MIKEINRDIFLLSQKSAPATENDRQTGEDLLETLIANSEHCVGMAANMIGVKKSIIAFLDESGITPIYTVMFNPEISKKTVPTIQKKDAFPFLAVRANANGIR